MIIDFGDSYQLECSVIDSVPSVKLVGKYYLVHYSSSTNEERCYINSGSLSFKLLDFDSNIVIKYYNSIVSDDGSEVLIDFTNNNENHVFIYFNLVTGEVGYDIK